MPLESVASAVPRWVRTPGASPYLFPMDGASASRWDFLWVNLHAATMRSGEAGYGEIHHAAVGVQEGYIRWMGRESELPDRPHALARRVLDGGGGWLTPGLVDAHTHLVFGGNRAPEFERRLSGVSYEEIAREGGGIRSTVQATRSASEEDLFQAARPRAEALLSEGVTTLEVKSGYGLDVETELRMLRVGRRLERELPLNVHGTFLGAHALPVEYEGRREEYLELVRREALPQAAREGLVDSVDAFCEAIAFDARECARIFDAAQAFNLPVRLHADQLSDGGGAALAARYRALSADHLEYASEEGIRAMADAGVVAGLLPGAFYFLGEKRPPPIAAMREAGVPFMVATDLNPGSSPLRSLLLAMNLACTLFRLTPVEALAGVTRNGARALGAGERIGTLEEGKLADLVLWEVDHPSELAYWIGGNPCRCVMKEGRIVAGAESFGGGRP